MKPRGMGGGRMARHTNCARNETADRGGGNGISVTVGAGTAVEEARSLAIRPDLRAQRNRRPCILAGLRDELSLVRQSAPGGATHSQSVDEFADALDLDVGEVRRTVPRHSRAAAAGREMGASDLVKQVALRAVAGLDVLHRGQLGRGDADCS